MTVSTRQILDLLGRPTLVRLMRERELTPTRENDERRKSLAHSYRGDVETLVLSLTRQEIVELFRKVTFQTGSEEVYLSNPGKYRLDELQAFAIRAFVGRRVRIPNEFTPVDDNEGEDRDEEDDDDSGDPDNEGEDWDEADDDGDPPNHDVGDDEDDEETDSVIGDDDDDVPVAELLRIDSDEWSRPRMIGRLLQQLGEDVPQRLRSARFQVFIGALAESGIEACLADDPSARVLSVSDDSPGIVAKIRLRLRAARAGAQPAGGTGRSLNKAAKVGPPSREGGPPITVQAGEQPIPQQVARPSDYNLAVLRLQFLTAVPSAERGALPAWPEGYLLAATRGLSLRAQEQSLLRAYAAGLCIGNHSPYDAIPRLSQVLSPSEWDALLDDFGALNPFQPELVQAIIEQVAPVTAPRSHASSWRESSALPPADLAPPDQARPKPQPLAASGRRGAPGDTEPDGDGSNKRDLGALAGMFDDE